MILVPYTKLLPATQLAVPEAKFVRIEHNDHYRLLLGEMWERGEAFTLVEHDVVPTRAQIESLEQCPSPWCFYGYHPGHWVPVFGCVRFSSELIAATRGAWDDPSWPWNQLDAKFHLYARERGGIPHWHYPHVKHDALYGCETGEERLPLSDELRSMLIEREAESLREIQSQR